MTTISKSWLQRQGVKGPDEDVAALAERTEEALELRVGAAIAELLNDEQLEEFERMMDNGTDEADKLAWLEVQCPDYTALVRIETIRLKRGIERSSDPADYIRSLTV